MSAVSVCLLCTLTASASVGTGASANRTRTRTASARFPLSVRKISVRKQHGRIVGAATIVNTGNARVRSTVGVLGLSRGSGATATGILTFSVPSLPPGSSRKVRFKSRPIHSLPVGSGTYKALICNDVYSQIRRFWQNTNCSAGGSLAISTTSLRPASGPALDTTITTHPARVSRRSTSVFRFASTVGSSAFECSLDGGPWLACTSPRRYATLVDGRHTFDVRAISPSGREDPTPAHASWSVDTFAPVVTLKSPASGSTTNDNKPAFSGAASTAPGDSSTIMVTVFSGRSRSPLPLQTLTATVSQRNWSVAPTQPLPAGTYTAQASQYDSAGNTGLSTPSTFTVGNTPPANESGLTSGNEPTASDSLTYSIGGTVSGLSGTVVLQDNGVDDLSVSSDGPFTFGTPVADGTAYNVTVKSNPSGQTCTTSGATGTVASANVTSVVVTCASSAGTRVG